MFMANKIPLFSEKINALSESLHVQPVDVRCLPCGQGQQVLRELGFRSNHRQDIYNSARSKISVSSHLKYCKNTKTNYPPARIMTEKQLDELFPEMTLNTNSRVRKKCLVYTLEKRLSARGSCGALKN